MKTHPTKALLKEVRIVLWKKFLQMGTFVVILVSIHFNLFNKFHFHIILVQQLLHPQIT